ncbi:helix-turn-helix domain-containing protein [Candidatus Woesearchaeota archaeon]|nr:helix-turn-helix domain-containing protein [Candidatus Woesearchaeota archaeon]
MKLLEVGVYHHDCWGSFSTKDFPTVSMTELGAVKIVRESKKGILVDSFWRITADTEKELSEYLSYVKKLPSSKKFRVYSINRDTAYVFIQFLSSSSSYASVLKTNAVPCGPIVQENELEIHTVATENPKETARLLGSLEALGEVKVFKIADFKEESLFSGLTHKQQQAILQAFQNDYYTWPRKITLDDLSKRLGVKRRTFQERLRNAEAKLIPFCIEKFVKERKF